MIFGDKKHKRLLVHFLNSVIESSSPIKDVEIEQTELTPDYVSGKWSRLDVLATTKTEKINIEIQLRDEGNFIERILFYWGSVYTQQIESGVDYHKLKRTILISILDFTLFEDSEDFWENSHIFRNKAKKRLTDLLELHFLELKKMRQVSINNPITVWLEFLRNPYSDTIAKFEQTMPELKEAKEVYGKIRSDKKAQELWRLREKAINDEFSALNNAERKGIEKGKAEGLAEGKAEGLAEGELKKARETAINLLSIGLSVEQIAKATGLSVEDVRSISSKK
jgi:predicted transposase/invertase (TIGR01784 family)